jgi:signal transduction histidine kinase
MKDWLRGKPGSFCVFLLIAGLVVGGLGWVTAAVLRLEYEQREAQAAAERDARLRLALWRLEGTIAPLRAREDGRPYDHYSAVFAVPQAYRRDGAVWPSGMVLEPSPLLSAEMEPWVLLHFQLNPGKNWVSPQVPEGRVREVLVKAGVLDGDKPVVKERAELLAHLNQTLPASRVLEEARAVVPVAEHKDLTVLVTTTAANQPRNMPPNANRPQQPAQQQAINLNPSFRDNDFDMRNSQANRQGFNNPEPYGKRENLNFALNNTMSNGTAWLAGSSEGDLDGVETWVHLTPLAAFWVTDDEGDHLFLARRVRVQTREVIQGVLLDAAALETDLAGLVQDLIPDARVVPQRETVPPHPERTLAALPFQLDPGPDQPPVAEPGWTPLRVGLTLSWIAALVALGAVGLGGWSLLDLSQRRIRFVSAVTHELRTPLTTLRLYLDMLMNGLVRDEAQRNDYVRTLHAEAERLNRLVTNVLDYSRLEDHRPQLAWQTCAGEDLVRQVSDTWRARCQDAEKELVIEDGLSGTKLWIDPGLVGQILGNLIDNACKYSREAPDRRIWLRTRVEGDQAVFEVEDRGPGVPRGERRAIFRAFRRGRGADVTAGGVGLGLALASRWARLLHGSLTLQPPSSAGGACFRLTLPCQKSC